MNAILKEEPPEVAGMAPGLDRVVRHCLEKAPEQRFQSARDLAFALEALSGVSVGAGLAPPAAPAAVKRGAARRAPAYILVGVALLAVLAAGFYIGRGLPTAPPSFQRLTFRRGTVWQARFAPDGKTIFYDTVPWEKDFEIFSTRPENPESRSLGIPGARLLAISSLGELAISLNMRVVLGPIMSGTLARLPLVGGTPREILEDVEFADWAPDGKALAVVRHVQGRARLEYPIGKVLYEASPPGWIQHLRVSPKGDLIAFVERTVVGGATVAGSVEVLDLAGRKKTLSSGWPNTWSIWGLAWTPRGDEVWFTAVQTGDYGDVLAVSLSGRQRLVLRVAGGLVLHDIASDGRVLLDRINLQWGVLGLAPGGDRETELSWLDGSQAADLSADGKTLLFTEIGRGVATGMAVFVRKTDGSPAVRLGDGRALALSPDGKWALALLSVSPPQLVLLPTGAGEPRPLARGAVNAYYGATWFPDGQRILFAGSESGHKSRLYAQEIAGGDPKSLSAEGTGPPLAVSPDGKTAAALNAEGKMVLCPLEGGEPRAVSGVSPGDVPIRWGADGRSLYVHRRFEVPARVYRLDLATQRKELWKELRPSDAAGLGPEIGPVLTPEGQSYVYSYIRMLTDLYLVEGLK